MKYPQIKKADSVPCPKEPFMKTENVTIKTNYKEMASVPCH